MDDHPLVDVAADVRRTAGLRYLNLATTVDPDALNRVVRLLHRIAGGDGAAVHLLDAQIQHQLAVVGRPLPDAPIADTFCLAVARDGRPVVLDDVAADGRYVQSPFAHGPDALGFYAAAPLSTGRFGTIGTVCAYGRHPHRPVPDGLAGALEDAAGIVTDLIEGHDAVRRLTTDAATDPLTGLPNRRLVLDHLTRQLANRDRSDTVVWFMDLDDFKSVNDAHGHLVGDHVLVRLAHRLVENTRDAEFVGRIAGDEFVLIGGDGLDDPIAEQRIRSALTGPIATPAGPVRVGVSIGKARAAADDTAERLIDIADRRMYAAKQLGAATA